MLRLAVIGAGIMGSNHARIATALRNTTLTHVVDPDRARAEALAGATGATATTSVEDLPGAVDAAVIASPTPLHAEIACLLLDAGISCLVEKPIATTLDEADAMIAAAERGAAQLMVGHVERFNPAVAELPRLLDEVLHVHAERVSVFSPRVPDDVVLDLMIHDIDIVCSLVDAPVTHVAAVGRRIRNQTNDLVATLLTFADGTTANLTASRLGQQKIRSLEITQPDSYVDVDLVNPKVTINKVDHAEYVDEGGTRYRQTGVVEIPYLEQRGEPLLVELTEFERAVLAGDRPRVDGHDGRRALEVALAVIDATGAPVERS
ncbi:MAG: Gfo/Idh/MocA family oxidoreductase [Acidimicrobiia bacterium]|nr:Gfo/Idh/MocA family oxidoreductase [Acidimicrobiia bacterium]